MHAFEAALAPVTACALLLCAACGRRSLGDASANDAGGGVDAAPVVDAGADPNACHAATTALGRITTDRYCTTLIRASLDSRSILGWSIACGPLNVATDASARAAFAAQLPKETTIDGYTRVGPTDGTRDYVFFQPASDFGGLGIVSFATSSLVFSASLQWATDSKILYPSFRPGTEIPPVCPAATLPNAAGVHTYGPPEMTYPDPAMVADVVAFVGTSALIPALEGHALIQTLVIPFDANWLVVIDSTLLE